jgi:hypothetical protein
MLYVGINILLHLTRPKDKSNLQMFCFVLKRFFCIRFEGQRQSIEHYGRQPGQDSQEKHEFKSLSVNPAKRQAAKKPANDDDDNVNLFGDEDEESKQIILVSDYVKTKAKSRNINFLFSIIIFQFQNPQLLQKVQLFLMYVLKY